MQEKPFSPLMASRAQPGAYLLVETGSLAGQRIELSTANQSLLVGRDRECNLVFDQQLEAVVGRRHARVEVRANGVFLIDLHSVNGTFLVDRAVEGEVLLRDGERFLLGGEGGPWLSVHIPAATHVAPPAMSPPSDFTAAPQSPYAAPISGAMMRRPSPVEPRAIPEEPAVVGWPPAAPLSASAPAAGPEHMRPSPPPPQYRESLSPSNSPVSPQPLRPAARSAVAPLMEQPAMQTKWLVRYPMLGQILFISFILSVACAVGTLLGLRSIWSSETTQPEVGGKSTGG